MKKRIITLALAAALLLGANAQSAQAAADINVSGSWQMSGFYQENLNSSVGDVSDNFDAPGDFSVIQRIGVALDIQNSENLKAHLALFVPHNVAWGAAGQAFGVGGGSLSVGLGLWMSQAYIDWYVPNTEVSVRLGLAPSIAPFYMGLPANPVMAYPAGGVTVTVPFNDNITMKAQWLRPTDGTEGSSTTNSSTTDMFMLTLPMTFDNFSITPWAAYLRADANNSTAPIFGSGRAYGLGEDTFWVGLTTQFKYDAFTFNADFLYSNSNSDPVNNSFYTNQAPVGAGNLYDGYGWLVDGAISYRHDELGLFKLSAWYSPGADSNGRNGVFATVSGTWITATALFIQDLHAAAAFMPNAGMETPNGQTAVMLSHAGISIFNDDTLVGGHVLWMKGNHHVNIATGRTFDVDFLTTKDSLVEVSLWATHRIYDDLLIGAEFNYIFENFDERVWNRTFDNGMRANLSFRYFF